MLPYNLAIVGSYIALLFVKPRRANIVLLSALLLLFTIPYWDQGAIGEAIDRHWGYSTPG